MTPLSPLYSCFYYLPVFFLLFPFLLETRDTPSVFIVLPHPANACEQRTANRQKDRKSEIIDLMSASIRGWRGRGAAQREEQGEGAEIELLAGKANGKSGEKKQRLRAKMTKIFRNAVMLGHYTVYVVISVPVLLLVAMNTPFLPQCTVGIASIHKRVLENSYKFLHNQFC